MLTQWVQWGRGEMQTALSRHAAIGLERGGRCGKALQLALVHPVPIVAIQLRDQNRFQLLANAVKKPLSHCKLTGLGTKIVPSGRLPRDSISLADKAEMTK